MLNPIHTIRNLYLETVSELKKCTWPTWAELWESTLVVIISVSLLGIFVFTMDTLVRAIVRALT